MSTIEIILIIIGGAMLIASVIVYFKNSSNVSFPIVLALGGIFMCAAQTVSASIPGVGDIKFTKDIAKNVATASSANAQALAAQDKAIKALRTELTSSQNGFAEYQETVNKRFAELNKKPVTVEYFTGYEIRQEALNQQVEAADKKTEASIEANKQLQKALESGFEF